MGNSDDLMSRLCEKMPTFSKGQKRLANYIMTSYDKAVFLTAARLGKAVAVSESTVVRFAMQLGYEGYPQFQEALEELVRTKLNSIQRIEIASGQMSQSKVLEYILDADAEKIKLTKDEIDKKAFEQASGQKIEYKIAPRRPGDLDVCYSDASKAFNELGWKADRGLLEMCEDSWRWQSNNPNGFDE